MKLRLINSRPIPQPGDGGSTAGRNVPLPHFAFTESSTAIKRSEATGCVGANRWSVNSLRWHSSNSNTSAFENAKPGALPFVLHSGNAGPVLPASDQVCSSPVAVAPPLRQRLVNDGRKQSDRGCHFHREMPCRLTAVRRIYGSPMRRYMSGDGHRQLPALG